MCIRDRLRAAHGEVRVLDSRSVEAGEADLTLDGKPLIWTAEPADGAAVFALVTTPGPREDIEAALSDTPGAHALDVTAFCKAAEAALAGHCDAQLVEVVP